MNRGSRQNGANNGNNTGRRARRRRAPAIPAAVRTGLDAQAYAYARLLADPCGAPLTHPVYAGTDGGILARFESDFLYFNGATEAAGLMLFNPGAIGPSGVNTTSLIAAPSTGPNVATAPTFINSSFQPGFGFLAATAQNVRCVAACLQVYWPGTEANRQGFISYGPVPGAAVLGDTPTVAQVAQIFPKTERMPNDHIEVKWRPADGDQMWGPMDQASPTIDQARKSAIGFAVQGLPVSTGVRVRLIAVYEYQPIWGQGMIAPINSRSTSSNSLDHVVNYLDTFTDWAYKGVAALNSAGRAAKAAAPYVRAVAYGAARTAPLLLS